MCCPGTRARTDGMDSGAGLVRRLRPAPPPTTCLHGADSAEPGSLRPVAETAGERAAAALPISRPDVVYRSATATLRQCCRHCAVRVARPETYDAAGESRKAASAELTGLTVTTERIRLLDSAATSCWVMPCASARILSRANTVGIDATGRQHQLTRMRGASARSRGSWRAPSPRARDVGRVKVVDWLPN